MRRFSLLLCLLLVSGPGCDSTAEVLATVRVMSQNLYLGGDLFLVANESDPQMVPVRVAQLYGTIEASDPAARMAAIAAEIARVNPALVGLQEVSTFYVQAPGDNLPGAPNTPATAVTFDFLALLLDALEAEGASYVVASRSDNTDVEFPATTDGRTFFDVRYQDADVILARSDVRTSNARETTFQALLTIPVGGVDQTFVRSYQSVDATVGDLAFTFFNTHLEVGGPAEALQVLQAAELVQAIGASGRTVLVGDINSDGNAAGTSYQTLTVPLDDAFAVGAGATCCQAANLRNGSSDLTTRIDVVLSRGFQGSTEAEVVLDEPADRIGGTLWPSDHAGVWAELEAVVL